MFGAVGEDYSTLDSIRQTGGIVPDETWPQTFDNFRRMAPMASKAGLDHITFHAGFLPHDPTDPSYATLAGRLEKVADLFADQRPDVLSRNRPGGRGVAPWIPGDAQSSERRCQFRSGQPDPVRQGRSDCRSDDAAAARASCHIKDATRTKTPGTWGEEVVVGTGEVDWPAFFGDAFRRRFHRDARDRARGRRLARRRTSRPRIGSSQRLHRVADMTRIGIIGLGFMGRMHIGAYAKLPGARLVAIADQDAKRARGDFSGGWGNIAGSAESLDMTGITGTTDFQALIRHPDVDVVDICVPTPAHEALAVAALEAGKHVLCEKPLALDSCVRRTDRRRRRTSQGPLHAGDVHAVLAAVGVAEAGR